MKKKVKIFVLQKNRNKVIFSLGSRFSSQPANSFFLSRFVVCTIKLQSPNKSPTQFKKKKVFLYENSYFPSPKASPGVIYQAVYLVIRTWLPQYFKKSQTRVQ